MVLSLAFGCGDGSLAAEPVHVSPEAVTGGEGYVADTGPTVAPTEDPDAPLRTEAPPDVADIPPYAVRTASGLASYAIRPGTGTTHPTANDRVSVHYSGWTTDGNMFDSSVERGEPATFPLSAVIAGWTEGVQLMVEGERRRLWIPEDLAYGGRPGAPQGMLVFDVELLRIVP